MSAAVSFNGAVNYPIEEADEPDEDAGQAHGPGGIVRRLIEGASDAPLGTLDESTAPTQRSE
jgi:hypothetical protein